MNIYKRYRYSPQIISHAIWLYHRFTLSYRDIEDILASGGIIVSYETIRQWCKKFTPAITGKLKKQHAAYGDYWFLDELQIKIKGNRYYLWRAVDQDANEQDSQISRNRNKRCALKFFKKLFKHQAQAPRKIITDKLASYKAALRELNCCIPHITEQYQNNRAEVSHQKIRQQQRQMRQFKTLAQAVRFLSGHGVINNHFRQQRHLLKARHYRLFRDKAFAQWQQATCAWNMETA